MNKHEQLSKQRKEAQVAGEVPEWMTTQGFTMFQKKYAYKGETVRGAFKRIASTLSKHYAENVEEANRKFFDLMWQGKLAPSTPVYCNTGTDRGLPVSCSGGYVGDSINEFYEGATEVAVLSKNGFGTSSYLGDIRHRGASFGNESGVASGVVPVFDSFLDVMTKVSQGANRRGAWAGYLPISHPDFWEMASYVQKHAGDANLGWCFSQEDVDKLQAGDSEMVKRWNRVLYLRMRTGKGYFFKTYTANKYTTQSMKNSGLTIKASQLCSEISLVSDSDHTYTCVLSSLNLMKWDEITDEDIYWSVAFLDCVCEEFLTKARGMKHMERAVRFTEKARALGLGTLGFHSLLQSRMIPIEGFEAHMLNNEIFSRIRNVAEEASKKLAEKYGEPEWCVGTGMRNGALLAVAPNMSSSLLCGGMSQGIEPWVSNTFMQKTAAGEFLRSNPELTKLLKQKGVYTKELLKDIDDHMGSVQHLECLTDEEKLVFKTAYEIDQRVLLRLASSRQRLIDQSQSLNLFFSADEDEAYIAEIHKEALLDEYIKSLYYVRSERGVVASKGECLACEG